MKHPHILGKVCLFVCKKCLKLYCDKCLEDFRSNVCEHEILNLCNSAPDIVEKVQSISRELDYLQTEAHEQRKEINATLQEIENLKEESKEVNITDLNRVKSNIIDSSNRLKRIREILKINETNTNSFDKIQEKFFKELAQLETYYKQYNKLINNTSPGNFNHLKDTKKEIKEEQIRHEKLKQSIVKLRYEIKFNENKVIKEQIEEWKEEFKEESEPVKIKEEFKRFAPYPRVDTIVHLERMRSRIEIFSIPSYNSYTYTIKNIALPFSFDFCVIEDGTIFISGGRLNYSFLKSLYKVVYYQDEKNPDNKIAHLELLSPMIQSRYNHTMVAVNNEVLYVIGGNSIFNCKTTEIYNVEENRWCEGGRLNNPRIFASACSMNRNKVYVFGGAENKEDKQTALIEYCDLRSRLKWIPLNISNSGLLLELHGRVRSGVIQISEDEIIIFGGDKEKNTPTNTVMILNAKKETLEKVDCLPFPLSVKDSKPVWYKTSIAIRTKPTFSRGYKTFIRNCNLVYSVIRNKWNYTKY